MALRFGMILFRIHDLYRWHSLKQRYISYVANIEMGKG